MSKYQDYRELMLQEATIPAGGGEVKMPESDWRAHMQKIGAKVYDNMPNVSSGERDSHVAKDKQGNRIGHYDTSKKSAYFEKRHGAGKLSESSMVNEAAGGNFVAKSGNNALTATADANGVLVICKEGSDKAGFELTKADAKRLCEWLSKA